MEDVFLLFIAKLSHILSTLIDFAVREPSALWGLLGSLIGGAITLLTTNLTLKHNLQLKSQEFKHQDATKRYEALKTLRLTYVIEPALKWLMAHTQEMQTVYGLQFTTEEERSNYVVQTEYLKDMATIQARLASLRSDEVNSLFTEVTRQRINLNSVVFNNLDDDAYKILQQQIDITSKLMELLFREASS